MNFYVNQIFNIPKLTISGGHQLSVDIGTRIMALQKRKIKSKCKQKFFSGSRDIRLDMNTN